MLSSVLEKNIKEEAEELSEAMEAAREDLDRKKKQLKKMEEIREDLLKEIERTDDALGKARREVWDAERAFYRKNRESTLLKAKAKAQDEKKRILEELSETFPDTPDDTVVKLSDLSPHILRKVQQRARMYKLQFGTIADVICDAIERSLK